MTNFISTLLPVIDNSGFVEMRKAFFDSDSRQPAFRIGGRYGFANDQLGAAIGKAIENSG
ncbi:MAG TPA: hypothetical protein VFI45_11930 [Candidatus Acidoferrum sp.]|nr:hypothetical protein [Candidatus Acidoferrum sp.]